MKKILFPLFLLLLFVTGAVFAESSVSAPETPAPAPYHEAPEATPEPEMILDCIQNRNALDGFRFRLDAEFLHVWFPNIQKADEAILTFGDEVWLIDCGDARGGANGAALLQKLGITKIDKLFITVPLSEHIAGLEKTNETVPVSELLVCFSSDGSDPMAAALAYAETAGISVSEVADGDTFTLGNGAVTLSFLCNNSPDLKVIDNSAAALLQYGSRRMFFASDLDQAGQQTLLARAGAEALQAEILKYPRHGKNYLDDEFLAAVSPSLAVITDCYENTLNGIQYCYWKKLNFYITDPYTKYVHLYTDGTTWVVEHVPMDSFD